MPFYTSNLLLAVMMPRDLELLSPILRPVELKQQAVLYDIGDKIGMVYFPSDAVVSMVVSLSTGEMVEAAMVGRDGVVGALAALDGKVSLTRAIVQVGGSGAACDVDAFKRVVLQSPTLLSLLLSHEQTVYAQAQQSAACNITHDVHARLSRWLLRARDLSGSDILPFTQEFLAEMLGVRRTSVSPAAHDLQRVGLIKYTRGKIQIVDLEGLKATSCECYETVRGHYDHLIGKNARSAKLAEP
jgi:CRP-like cAMP-binding protein